MACPGTVPVPSARTYPFMASAGDLTYLWGGLKNTEPKAVFIYRRDTEVWTRQFAAGRHPPAGLSDGGCTMSGHKLYLYGGYDNSKCNCGDLYELNTQTWQWRKLSDGSAGGPGKKYECRMISYQDQLLVVGGCYDEMPSSRQAGAKYTSEGSSVYTNEVHVYNLTSGLWFTPSMKGSRPPPCSSFSLTRTSEDRAIMFGGSIPSGRSSEAHVLHLPTMTWSQHKEGEGDPWPESRWDHIAACLGYGEPHQKLLISGGVGGSLTYDDIWLLDPQSGRMEEVQVPVKYKKLIQRYGHCAAAVIAKSACEVIIFGGKKEYNGSSIADQVVLRFEIQEGKWSLTDIADQTQHRCPARIATKRRIILSSNNKDDTIRRLEQHLKDSQVKEKDLQRRAGKLQTQVIDVNKRAEELQTQMNAANRKAEASNKRIGELQKLVDDAKRRSKASNKRDGELQTQVNAANRKAEELQTQLDDANRRAGELQILVDDANGRAGELQTQVEDSNRRAETSNRRAGELQTQLNAANRRAEASNRRVGELQTQVDDVNRRAEASNRRAGELQIQLNAANRRDEASNRRVGKLQIQMDDANRRAETSNRRAGELQTQVADANRRAETSNRRAGELQTQVEDANRRAETSNRRAGELQIQLNAANRRDDASNRRVGELQTQVDDANRRAEASNRRAGELQTQVDVTNRQAEASNRRAGELQTQVDVANRQAEASNKRAGELQTLVNYANRRAGELQTQVDVTNRHAEASNRRAGELQTQVDVANRGAEASNRRVGELRTQVDDANRRAEASNRRAGELQTQVDVANRGVEASNRRAGELQTLVNYANRRAGELQTQVHDANRGAEASNRRAGELQRQVQDAENRMQDLERSLAETTQELRQREDLSTHWVVRREEIELTGPDLGVGGWATVTVANFRGTQVAVKKIHHEIICRHNLQLFQREISMAARLHHPNLIQFIGATMEGEMMIVMELMATSLRSQLKSEEYFPPKVVKAISLDVARGLNYLHLIQPDPTVHRDISSANVLLEQLTLNNWRAKLTDYGSVNLVRQLRTANPGSPAYAAPEASNPHLQSPKMDIYSFGALVLEMLTGRLPAPDNRPGMFLKVQHEQLLHLIRRCLNGNPEDRPSASNIISELSPHD